jgi:nucleotide-binding universal stress UspA family protein
MSVGTTKEVAMARRGPIIVGYDERARVLADHGATLARELGLEAEGLAVADDATPGATLVRLARERDARALVVGSHGHSRLTGVVGHTSAEVIHAAPCPVVVRGPAAAL